MRRPSTMRRRRQVLRTARAVMRADYRDPDLSLADVARDAGTSPRQLQRIFRELAGTDFRTELLALRMNKARGLLAREKNPLPIRVAAGRVGYRQASGLRQAFRRFYGYNPSAVQPVAPQYIGNWIPSGKDREPD